MNSCTSVFSLFFKQIYFLSFPIGSMEKSSPMFSPDLIHDYLYGYKRIRLVSSEEVVTALQKGNSTFSLYHCCRNYEVFVLLCSLQLLFFQKILVDLFVSNSPD